MVNPAVEFPALFKSFFELVKSNRAEEARGLGLKLRGILDALPEDIEWDEIPEEKFLSVAIIHHPRSRELLDDLITKLEESLS